MRVLDRERDGDVVVLDAPPAWAPEQAGRVESSRPPRTNWRLSALVLASYLSLAFAYFGATWADPANRFVGTRGDPTLFVWYLRWVPWAIAHGHNPLFSNYVNAPHGINLMWNTAVVLPALVMAPITALWGPIVTYNLLATIAVGLSGWTAWWAFRRIGGLTWGAWVGGAAFAFSPFLISQSLGHLHLTLAFLLPVIAVAAHEVLVGQRLPARRGGIILGLLVAAQALTGEELLAIAGIAIVVGTVVLAVLLPREVASRVGHAGRGLVWAIGSFLVVAGGPLLFQFIGPQAVHGPAQPRDLYVTDLYAPVLPPPLTWLHNHWTSVYTQRFASKGGEWSAFLGVGLILVLVALVVRLRKRRGVLAAGLTALIMLVFSFGPHLHVGGHNWSFPMPWNLVGGMPPLDSLLPVRMMVAVDFLAAGLLGLAAERAFHVRRWARPGAVAAVVLAVVFALPITNYPSSGLYVPPFFRSKAVDAIPQGSLAVVAPYPLPENVYTLRWQVASGFRYRTSGGYALVPGDAGKPSFSGPDTATHEVLTSIQGGVPVQNLDFLAVIAMREEVRRSGAATVLVGPMAHQDAAVVLFEELLGAPPTLISGGVAMWTGVPSLLR